MKSLFEEAGGSFTYSQAEIIPGAVTFNLDLPSNKPEI